MTVCKYITINALPSSKTRHGLIQVDEAFESEVMQHSAEHAPASCIS